MDIAIDKSRAPQPTNSSYAQYENLKKITCFAVGLILFISGVLLESLYINHSFACIAFALGGTAWLCLLIEHVKKGCTRQSIESDSLATKEFEPASQSAASIRKQLLPEDDVFCTGLVNHSFIEVDEKRRKTKQKIVSFFEDSEINPLSTQETRAMGIMLGMACGDYLGAPYEGLQFQNESYEPGQALNRFSLEEGQWTDDTSMGLCLADVLIQHRGLDGIQLMWAFHDWWEHGYNNPFTKEARNSVGLGGNIELAFNEFSKLQQNSSFGRAVKGKYATQAGDLFTNGNGSLMRLGSVAIAARDEKEALSLAWEQSKVTHQGDEAAGCCQLLAFLLFHALYSNIIDANLRKIEIFGKLESFNCQIPSVNGLAQASSEVENPKTGRNENWNWKARDFSIDSVRLSNCAGSYAMDGLAMALHYVLTTDSFEEAIVRATTRGGDADTVGAIVGQLAGAIYGVEDIPKAWIENIHQWDRNGEIATRAYLLCHLHSK